MLSLHSFPACCRVCLPVMKLPTGKSSISGDSEFAEEIIRIGKNLHWDAEQDLSGVMGDILAHRVVQAGQNLVHWHTETIRNLLQTLMEYWTEEQPLLAKPANLHEFIREVDRLQDETATSGTAGECLIVK